MNTTLCVNYISGKLGEKNIGGFPGGAVEKNPSANAEDARDVGSTAGSGRSPGVGNGSTLQYSCLENSMDRGAWWSDCPSDCRVRHSWAHSTTTAMFFTISFSTSVPLCGRQGDAVSKKKKSLHFYLHCDGSAFCSEGWCVQVLAGMVCT